MNAPPDRDAVLAHCTDQYANMHLSPAAIEGAIRLLDQPIPDPTTGEDTSSWIQDDANVLT